MTPVTIAISCPHCESEIVHRLHAGELSQQEERRLDLRRDWFRCSECGHVWSPGPVPEDAVLRAMWGEE